MNILFVSAVLPYPLYSGGQIRIYNLLKVLAKKHDIKLCAFIRERSEENLVKELKFCKEVHVVLRGHAWQPRYVLRSIFGVYPLLYASYDNGQMRQEIGQILKESNTDIVHLEPSYVWPSMPKTHIPLVIAEHNIEYQVFEHFVSRVAFLPIKPFLALDILKHKYWEEKVWHAGNHIITVSDSDAAVVRKRGSSTVSVVPNGVDLDFFQMGKRRDWSNSPRCLFVGDFSWMQNRDAVRFLMEAVWKNIVVRFPNAKLRIVGRNIPRPLLTDLKKVHAEVNERVDDIRTEYETADVMLAPIRVGGGTKFKILEAMAVGLPVITTPLGALGLPVKDKENILIATSPTDFSLALGFLATSENRTDHIVKKARKLIEQDFSWKKIAQELDTVWQNVYEQGN